MKSLKSYKAGYVHFAPLTRERNRHYPDNNSEKHHLRVDVDISVAIYAGQTTYILTP